MCCNGTVRLQFHRIFVEYLFVRFFISRLHFACPSCVPKIFTRSSLLSIKSIKYIGKKGRAKIKFRKIKRFVTKRNLSVCKIYDMILNRVTGKIVHLSHQLCNSLYNFYIPFHNCLTITRDKLERLDRAKCKTRGCDVVRSYDEMCSS